MKIGVAIPCYHGHIERLIELLDSIEQQTRKPDNVVVSCSSTNSAFDVKQYSFPLEIILTEEFKNTAQNRNIAANKLTNMDYITFIDADDIMHPQRIEALLTVFIHTNCDIILHNMLLNKQQFQLFDEVFIRTNELIKCYSGCIRHIDFNRYRHQHIAHGHCSVTQAVFNKIKYSEGPEFKSKEDCVFCYNVFSLPNAKNVYILNPLTLYIKSGTQR